MIDRWQDLLLEDLHQVGQVHHHARRGRNLAAHGDLEVVVVPVAVRVVADPVQPPVLLVGELGVVEPVTGAEGLAPRSGRGAQV